MEDIEKAGNLAYKFIEWGRWIADNPWSIPLILLLAYIIRNYIKRK